MGAILSLNKSKASKPITSEDVAHELTTQSSSLEDIQKTLAQLLTEIPGTEGAEECSVDLNLQEVFRHTALLQGIQETLDFLLTETRTSNEIKKELYQTESRLYKLEKDMKDCNVKRKEMRQSLKQVKTALGETKARRDSVLSENEEMEQTVQRHTSKLNEMERENWQLVRQLQDLNEKNATVADELRAEEIKVKRYQQQFSERELRKREGRHLKIVILYRNCPSDICHSLAEDLTKDHPNYSYSILRLKSANRQTALDENATVAIVVYSPENRSWDTHLDLKKELGLNTVIFLPIIEEDRRANPQVPTATGAVQICQGSWITYDPSRSPPRMNLSDKEFRDLQDILKLAT